MYRYIIKHKNNYIVYLPLKGLAFIANASMVNLLDDFNRNPALLKTIWNEERDFLKSIGCFIPDIHPFPKEPNEVFFPTTAVLCMTNACNFKCVYCYASAGNQRFRELPLMFGQKAIDIVYENAKQLNQKTFSVSFHGGGEPTLPFEKFKKLTTYARTKNIPALIDLTSNGYWNKNKLEWILSNIDKLTISFDGIEEVQNSQRPLLNGNPTYSTVFDNLKLIDGYGIDYGIRFTVTDGNIDKLKESIEFLCNNTYCQNFQVEPSFNVGRAATDNSKLKNHEKFIDNFISAYEISLSYGRHLYYSGARPWIITDRFCAANYDALIVTPSGILTSCYEVSDEKHSLAGYFLFGHIEHYLATMNYELRNQFLKKISERRKQCESCFCYWHCAGDCPAKTFSNSKNGHLHYSSRCRVNREITKELIFRKIVEGNGVMQAFPKEYYCEGIEA